MHVRAYTQQNNCFLFVQQTLNVEHCSKSVNSPRPLGKLKLSAQTGLPQRMAAGRVTRFHAGNIILILFWPFGVILFYGRVLNLTICELIGKLSSYRTMIILWEQAQLCLRTHLICTRLHNSCIVGWSLYTKN